MSPAKPNPSHLTVWKAKYLIPYLGDKRTQGAELYHKPQIIENACLVIKDRRLVYLGRNAPAGCKIHDLGDTIILPPLSNCHTHLQLSCLAGQTRMGAGFVEWLKSLIPLILKILREGFGEKEASAVKHACESLAQTGCVNTGDIGGSLPIALSVCSWATHASHLDPIFFCENFGFNSQDSVWPERCRTEISENNFLAPQCAPAGHALYSTSPTLLQGSHAYCIRHGKPFTFHLAESFDEYELLGSGTGELMELYRGSVLPESWHPPGTTPLRYADKLGILTPETIAVHGACFDDEEIRAFAQTGAWLCLCPRSNKGIGVGMPEIRSMLAHNLPLCLGSDGLTSAPDMDIRQEALLLHNCYDIPWPVLWKLAVVNGAIALGKTPPKLMEGAPARFSVWPIE